MPSNNNNVFVLSPFLMRGCKRVSHVMCKIVNVALDDNNNVKMPITLTKKYSDYV